MFLSQEQLAELTGYKRMAEQKRWLRANEVRFLVDRWGRPRVLVAEVERIMLSGADTDPELVEPNWDAMHRRRDR